MVPNQVENWSCNPVVLLLMVLFGWYSLVSNGFITGYGVKPWFSSLFISEMAVNYSC